MRAGTELVMPPKLVAAVSALTEAQVLDAQGWERWHTPWWPAAVAFWTTTAPGLTAGYWAARDAPDPAPRSRIFGARSAWKEASSRAG